MMWHYRYYGNDAGYAAAARSYLTIDRGLLPAELNIYYVGCLGLSSLHRPSGSDLRRLLQSGPVVFFSASATGDHAMVAAGWNGGANHYEVANPNHVQFQRSKPTRVIRLHRPARIPLHFSGRIRTWRLRLVLALIPIRRPTGAC